MKSPLLFVAKSSGRTRTDTDDAARLLSYLLFFISRIRELEN